MKNLGKVKAWGVVSKDYAVLRELTFHTREEARFAAFIHNGRVVKLTITMHPEK